MTDSVCSLVSSLSGAIASQRIWSSGQSGTPPLAMALVKWFEVACQLSKTSTTPTMRKTASLAGNITELAKSAGTLVESISSSLTTDAHLSQDLGMKRAVLERFCEYVLTAYRSFLSQPQHFKAIWKALCRTATRFAPPSFAGGRLCARVFSESCSMISILTQQTAGILAKSLAKDLAQRTVAHRIMNSLAFVRFFMFHMSALLKRMHSDPSVDDTAAFQHAMPMFDDVLGSLVTPHNMAFMPRNIADNMHNLVLAVAEKVVVAMFSHSVKELVSYVDTWQISRSFAWCFPTSTHFLPTSNRSYLHRHKSLVSALALAVDRDPTSILAALGSAASSAISERVSLSTAYEQLVSSVAVSAIKVATPDVFELWEIAAFDVLSWSSPGSLGACIVADAWIIVARNALPSALVVSMMDSIIDIAYSAPESISDMARSRFATLFDGFVQGISQDDLTAWLARLVARFDNQSAGIGLVYAMVPWSVFTDSGALLSIRKAAQQIKATTGCAAIVAATGLALAGEASIVGNILAMAVSLAQSDLAFPASVLSECSSHICSQNGKAFDSHPASAVMLGLLCGCFAETDLEQPLLMPVGKAVKPVFAFLLDSARPWIVRHFAHRQLIRFAMDEHNAHIVEAVATGSAEQALLQFIQKVPAGKPIANGEQDHVYRAVFDINAPKESLMSEDSGITGLLEAISRLRQELAATRDMALDQDDVCLLRVSIYLVNTFANNGTSWVYPMGQTSKHTLLDIQQMPTRCGTCLRQASAARHHHIMNKIVIPRLSTFLYSTFQDETIFSFARCPLLGLSGIVLSEPVNLTNSEYEWVKKARNSNTEAIEEQVYAISNSDDDIQEEIGAHNAVIEEVDKNVCEVIANTTQPPADDILGVFEPSNKKFFSCNIADN
ncbi:hypothetical protein DL89DRAFT_285854 [Linderina pennispora]|uniref:Uncharacterized protein n=1 Tax=Linderina pennispora TaxID=61395 RepID=A0A1Y1W145_9FUNG|nr:uncharacterized protein DL89DRAFT_285854 [Linderina pennispora]ORX67227.1 hypothetical protein DL89DRAFT_285854 [Linderina pennispora]